jgi:phosphopantothenoylcysteine decarboxylase/phosphopantothenate--cysteine ligase
LVISLKNKRILITAGPTWVPIDAVRVISNTASAETGILLAGKAKARGAAVTLFLGPAPKNDCRLDKSVKIIRFNFFNELKNGLLRELKTKKYDFIIHSAAVSDYRLKKVYRKKIHSGLNKLKIELIPNLKILDLFKKIDRYLKVIAFKFEVGLKKPDLIKKAKELLSCSKADLVVANTLKKRKYTAYIVSPEGVLKEVHSKNALADGLLAKLGDLNE